MGSVSHVSTSPPSLTALMSVYMKIGILGFGGGYAVLSFIRTEIVTEHAWLSGSQFDHVVEMTAFAPGPTTSNVLASIAYRLHGWRGLIFGITAALWPSFLLILILAAATKILHNPWLLGALHGIEVAVVGLLIDVVWTLWKDVPHVALTSALAVLALGLTLAGMNPAITIVIAAGVGWGDFMVRHQVLHGHGKLAKVSPPKTDTDDFA